MKNKTPTDDEMRATIERLRATLERSDVSLSTDKRKQLEAFVREGLALLGEGSGRGAALMS